MSALKPSILTIGKFLFYSVSDHGITFTPETPRDEWLNAVKRICLMHDGAVKTRELTLMMLADALIFGEQAYGEEYAQAIDGMRQALELSPKTISNAVGAYRRIPATLRRDGLSLSHYKEISPLEPDKQAEFIARAIDERMSVQALKKEIAAAFPKTKRGKTRKAAEVKDDEDSAMQKLVDSLTYVLATDINELSAQWKQHFETAYKIYRRRFLTKRKKK